MQPKWKRNASAEQGVAHYHSYRRDYIHKTPHYPMGAMSPRGSQYRAVTFDGRTQTFKTLAEAKAFTFLGH